MRIRPASTVTSALVGASLGALAVLSSLGLTTPAALAAEDTAVRASHDPVVIGHRGLPSEAPENTLASIDRASKKGVRWVENDVQRTKDGALIVMHDTTLERTTDAKQRYPRRAPWKVSDFTLAEIEKLDAGSWFDRRFTGERVPTLDRYLRRVDHNRQKLLLEMKAPELYPGIERQIVDGLRRAGWLDQRHVQGGLVVQSFNATSLKTLHHLRPDLKEGFLGCPQGHGAPLLRGLRRPDQPQLREGHPHLGPRRPRAQGTARQAAGDLRVDGGRRRSGGRPGAARRGRHHQQLRARHRRRPGRGLGRPVLPERQRPGHRRADGHRLVRQRPAVPA
ncbi:hypothetical protein GCM10020000_61570 [Streptomyces olivoverticillatus]